MKSHTDDPAAITLFDAWYRHHGRNTYAGMRGVAAYRWDAATASWIDLCAIGPELEITAMLAKNRPDLLPIQIREIDGKYHLFVNAAGAASDPE